MARRKAEVVTSENYKEKAKAIREKGMTLEIVNEMAAFQNEHYIKFNGYSCKKTWIISANGKWYHCPNHQKAAQRAKGAILPTIGKVGGITDAEKKNSTPKKSTEKKATGKATEKAKNSAPKKKATKKEVKEQMATCLQNSIDSMTMMMELIKQL